MTGAPSIAIVGAGFSGALLAVHLTRWGVGRLDIVLVDRAGSRGRGLAQSAGNPNHLLNVRVENMRALPEHPSHFRDWLERRTGQTPHARLRGADRIVTLRADRVVNCTGPATAFAQTGDPLIRALLSKGLANTDRVGLGLEVTAECAIIDASDHRHDSLFATGPLTRGAFREMLAFPAGPIFDSESRLLKGLRRHFRFASTGWSEPRSTSRPLGATSMPEEVLKTPGEARSRLH